MSSPLNTLYATVNATSHVYQNALDIGRKMEPDADYSYLVSSAASRVALLYAYAARKYPEWAERLFEHVMDDLYQKDADALVQMWDGLLEKAENGEVE